MLEEIDLYGQKGPRAAKLRAFETKTLSGPEVILEAWFGNSQKRRVCGAKNFFFLMGFQKNIPSRPLAEKGGEG